jgi:flap endonuclease-1
MGVKIGGIIEKREIKLEDLSGKGVAIDAYNMIYQFLSIIRRPDGTPLVNARGDVTSHLSGLIYRTTNLIGAGIKTIFVFDGTPPRLKKKTIEKRRKIREEAEMAWVKAREAGDAGAIKYAKASSRINPGMISDAKRLLEYMGVPYIQAPSEGEAQASYIVINGDAYCAASQDYDSLLFGSKILVRNLAAKRNPEMIDLDSGLAKLGINREQLIDMAILVGTDFNDGVKGIGPKTALRLVKKHESIERVLSDIHKEIEDLELIKDFFLHPDITSYDIKWHSPEEEKILEFLCEGHGFSEDRIKKALNLIEMNQKKLDEWG